MHAVMKPAQQFGHAMQILLLIYLIFRNLSLSRCIVTEIFAVHDQIVGPSSPLSDILLCSATLLNVQGNKTLYKNSSAHGDTELFFHCLKRYNRI